MSVVTIQGNLGSGAPEIGRELSNMLDADYVDREIITKVALRVNRQEHEVIEKEQPPTSLLGRIAQSLRRAGIYGAGVEGTYLPSCQIPLGNIHFLQALESVIKDMAQGHSFMIGGQGSQFILKDYPQAFHVLIVAPIAMRIPRVMQNLNLPQGIAMTEIAHFDASNREFIKRYFHAELEDPIFYDLVINTRSLSIQAAASTIVDSIPFFNFIQSGQIGSVTERII